MTPKAARDKKIGGQNANFKGHHLLRNSPMLKKEVMNDPQKPPKFQNWGHFCKMCSYDPMSPSSVIPAFVCGLPLVTKLKKP